MCAFGWGRGGGRFPCLRLQKSSRAGWVRSTVKPGPPARPRWFVANAHIPVPQHTHTTITKWAMHHIVTACSQSEKRREGRTAREESPPPRHVHAIVLKHSAYFCLFGSCFQVRTISPWPLTARPDQDPYAGAHGPNARCITPSRFPSTSCLT